jgi:CheY-like chemotaxis protein
MNSPLGSGKPNTVLRDPTEVMTPRILIVDDERQVHAAIRLRLAGEYDLVFCLNARDALESISKNRFDLCLVDIHMPKMDGIVFVDAARRLDSELGYVIISAFDTDVNLRRTIPLQVYDFLSKPLPERDGFEGRIREWIERTQQRRRENELARRAESIVSELDSAFIEREIELLASENARAALRQTATLLTSVHAHLIAGTALLASRAKIDHYAAQLHRNMEEARRAAEAAMTSSEGFFDSSYGDRDSSQAVANDGIQDAVNIALRMGRAGESNKIIDFKPLDCRLCIRGITGINFLLMLVPSLGIALHLAAPNTTVRIQTDHCTRFDAITRDPQLRNHFWINRRNVPGSNSCLAISITANAAPLGRPEIEAWLKCEYAPLSAVTARGLLSGVLKCQGLLGFSLSPSSTQFRLILALPV